MKTWIVDWYVILLSEHCKGACKEEYVQGYISCIWNYCFELLAVGFQWLLGVRIRSSTIHFSVAHNSKMDNSHGKYICCDSNIRMLSGIAFSFTNCNVLWWFCIYVESMPSKIYCRPTYSYMEERLLSKRHGHFHARNLLVRLVLTSCYMVLITVIAAAMPFFGDFVSICGAVGFTPLDFVFPALAFLKAGKLPKRTGLRVSVQIINIAIAAWFSVVAILGCIGSIRFIIKDVKTYKFFYDM